MGLRNMWNAWWMSSPRGPTGRAAKFGKTKERQLTRIGFDELDVVWVEFAHELVV